MILIPPLKKSYGSHFTLSVPETRLERGKIYSVIGPNGSGKSTFARICSGTLATDDRAAPLDFSVSYMPQRSCGFNFSVFKNLALVSHNISDIERLMDALQLLHLQHKNARTLSVGETARLALARVLLLDSDLLILDEPTASMDMHLCLASERIIREYAVRHNAAVIFITHSVSQAKRISDFVLFFSGGRLVESGAASDVLTAPTQDATRDFLKFSTL